MTTLERVAKAIVDEETRQLTDGRMSNELNAYPVAMAALLALRETDEDTLAAAPGLRGGDWYTGGRAAALRDMIDHIVKEPV